MIAHIVLKRNSTDNDGRLIVDLAKYWMKRYTDAKKCGEPQRENSES